jgi:hypothetical protein
VSNPAVVPDTGILLAAAYGEPIDPKAPAAIRALDLLRRRGVRTVVPTSVADELRGLFADIDGILEFLRSALTELAVTTPSRNGLIEAEEVLVRTKSKAPAGMSRFFEAIEIQVSNLISRNPGTALRLVLAEALTSAMVIREGVFLKAIPAWMETPQSPRISELSAAPKPSGIGGADWDHLRVCQWIGDQSDTRVIFLVFERQLHLRRNIISASLPRVEVTIPPFLAGHIDE